MVWNLQKTRMKVELWFLSDLPGCITCGESIEGAVVNELDAKKAWLEVYYQNNNCEVILT